MKTWHVSLSTLILAISSIVPVSAEPAPRTVVAWISIDGVRPDYAGRADTPFFDKLQKEGAYSSALKPVFPSLTFPSHVSQSTGVKVQDHGVPLNSFYCSERDRNYFYPGFPDLLQSEPIWTTAARQGFRVAVHDWVMSHGQTGQWATAYFRDRYDQSLSCHDRLGLLKEAWINDQHEEPLRLIMGYMDTPDKLGHQYGPDAPEIATGMEEMDRYMMSFLEHGLEKFKQTMRPEDRFYLVVTSDHGMSGVHTAVHPNRVAGLDDSEADKQVIVTAGGNIAHYFFHKIKDPAARAVRQQKAMDDLRAQGFDYMRVFTREELPPHWGYAHPTRSGDLVAVLDTGHIFSRRAEGIASNVEAAGGPLGMHGYDPDDDNNMMGILYVWRYPDLIGGVDLGPAHMLQLHATVAKLLGIDPSPDADPAYILSDVLY